MYAVSVYVFFVAVLIYSAGFFAGVGVPKSIDGGPRTPVPVAVGLDLLLLTLFGEFGFHCLPVGGGALDRIIGDGVLLF